jgi:hypothetical protein
LERPAPIPVERHVLNEARDGLTHTHTHSGGDGGRREKGCREALTGADTKMGPKTGESKSPQDKVSNQYIQHNTM